MILACARTKLGVVAADERDGGRAPGAQPRPHGRPRDRDRHGLRAAAATARRSGSGCSPRCACRAGRAARRRSPSCWPRPGCRRDARRASTPRRSSPRRRATRSASASARRRSSWCARRATSSTGRPSPADDVAGRRARVGARERRATASRSCTASTSTSSAGGPSAHYGDADLRRSCSPHRASWARELDLEVALLPDQPRGRVRRAPAPRSTGWPTGSSSTPARGRTTRGRSATRWRSRGLPAVEVHLSDVDAREEFRRDVGRSATSASATVTGQGAEGYREALARLAQELAQR